MYKRKKKLIEPRLQLKFAGLFLAMAGLAALTQSIVVAYFLNATAGALPTDGLTLRANLGPILAKSYVITFLVLVPVMLAIGVRTTFRVVGPLHRFRLHLGEIARGEDPGICRIREDDELQDFCKLLNEAVGALSVRAEAVRGAEAADTSVANSRQSA